MKDMLNYTLTYIEMNRVEETRRYEVIISGRNKADAKKKFLLEPTKYLHDYKGRNEKKERYIQIKEIKK